MDFDADLAVLAAMRESHPSNLCARSFDVKYFETLSPEDKRRLLKICKPSIYNPDSLVGCFVNNPDDYDRFKPFFSRVLSACHKVPLDAVHAVHASDWELPEGATYDVSALDLGPLSMRTRVGRNLAGFPLPGSMTQAQRCELEEKMCEAFDVLMGMAAYGGCYCSITPGHRHYIENEKYEELV